MSRFMVALCCNLVAAAACSSSTGDFGGGGQGPSGGGSAGGAEQGGDGQGGDPAMGGGTADGGGTTVDDRIDPIALGHAWTYDVQELGAFPLCPGGSHTGETVDALTIDGKEAFEVTNLCANVASSYYAVDGDVVQVDYEGTWILALDAPVEEGHTWSNGTSTFTWHDEGTLTVPAGTFGDCWRATQNVAYDAYTIFCRGVGPVHWHSEDLNGNGFDAVLTAKSF